MNKYFIFLLIFIVSKAHSQMNGAPQMSDAVVETDWLSIGLILTFFFFLIVIYKSYHSGVESGNHSRQKDEVEHELIEKND